MVAIGATGPAYTSPHIITENDIISTFEDAIFIKNYSFCKERDYWVWGLSKDGDLYCKGQISGTYGPRFKDWTIYSMLPYKLSFKDMTRVILGLKVHELIEVIEIFK